MTTTESIFLNLCSLIKEGSQALQTWQKGRNEFEPFYKDMLTEIDKLSLLIVNDDSILISVNNQKLLRKCFQIITMFGLTPCLMPGLGITWSKKYSNDLTNLPIRELNDLDKYAVLKTCTEFLSRCYTVPVLKKIIITFHLSDYLAALIQLSFAPLKKPGTHNDFIMTADLYEQLLLDRKEFLAIYKNLVANSFKPILMKELMVLQSAQNPPLPTFAKKLISKEMSSLLLCPGGLLSLVRCFIENYNTDVGFEWKKIHMICKIISSKHGNGTELEYLENICAQIKQILLLKNIHYLTVAVSCIFRLNEKYSNYTSVKRLLEEIFFSFNNNVLYSKSNDPGTIMYTSTEVEHKIKILHVSMSTSQLKWSPEHILANLYLLFLLYMKCNKNNDLKQNVKETILAALDRCNTNNILNVMNEFLFNKNELKIEFVEYEAGVMMKSTNCYEQTQGNNLVAFLELVKISSLEVNKKIIENCFKILVNMDTHRNKLDLLAPEEIVTPQHEKYAVILQVLSEITTSSKLFSILKQDFTIILDFIETYLSKNVTEHNNDCVAIMLVLLNTVLSSKAKSNEIKTHCKKMLPLIVEIEKESNEYNKILCQEIIQTCTVNKKEPSLTPFALAVEDVLDHLLPVRAHGLNELTKLIDNKDLETLSKKNLLFCLFEEQLKDADTYIYLAAINAISSLGNHCTEDVLNILCKEYVCIASEECSTKEMQSKRVEQRLKIGDAIVKVVKRIGEVAVVHKTILLNTMLCACRDEEPFIRASALSNLAEIALVMNYKMGTIIHEVLLCIWGILESDKAVECRRAAVMIITSLLKGLDKHTLVEIKESLLPIYRTLKNLHYDSAEDDVVSLHAQLALEELNEIVSDYLKPKLILEKNIKISKQCNNIIYK